MFFFLQITTQSGGRVEVCSATFHSIFGLGRKRTGNIMFSWVTATHDRKRELDPEWTSEARKWSRRLRLASNPFDAASRYNYGRDKTPHKRYLPSTLGIHQMFELYNEEHPDHSTIHCMFSNLTLGFSLPHNKIVMCSALSTKTKLPL